MKEVFLALKQSCSSSGFGDEEGLCKSVFIHDVSILPRYMKAGWFIYRCNGFQRVVELDVELKMEKCNDTPECPESPKPNNKRGR